MIARPAVPVETLEAVEEIDACPETERSPVSDVVSTPRPIHVEVCGSFTIHRGSLVIQHNH